MLAKGFAVDQFARDIVRRMILADLVNRQDIWMIEPDDRARFLFKPLQRALVAGKTRGQEFQRRLATALMSVA